MRGEGVRGVKGVRGGVSGGGGVRGGGEGVRGGGGGGLVSSIVYGDDVWQMKKWKWLEVMEPPRIPVRPNG